MLRRPFWRVCGDGAYLCCERTLRLDVVVNNDVAERLKTLAQFIFSRSRNSTKPRAASGGSMYMWTVRPGGEAGCLPWITITPLSTAPPSDHKYTDPYEQILLYFGDQGQKPTRSNSSLAGQVSLRSEFPGLRLRFRSEFSGQAAALYQVTNVLNPPRRNTRP